MTSEQYKIYKKILKMYRQGVSIKYIAKVANMSESSVKRVLKNVGEIASDADKTKQKLQAKKIIQLYKDNVPLRQIADKLNISLDRLKYNLIYIEYIGRKENRTTIKEIMSLYNRGEGFDSIADKTGLLMETVQYRIEIEQLKQKKNTRRK